MNEFNNVGNEKIISSTPYLAEKIKEKASEVEENENNLEV